MAAIRVIPRLDIKGPNLVKGIHLEGLRVLGTPEQFARHYYETGADELFYQDVVASLYERNSLNDIISRTAREIFIPLTVGGGLRSMEDIRDALRAGADKVSINTAAIKDPELIRKASREYGSSTIVVAIEAIRESDGRYLAYTDNGREYTGVEVIAWAQKAEEYGAGEIVLTSVDREGTGDGYDIELTRAVSEAVSIPVIAHGGPGKAAHVVDVIRDGGADAVAVAGILHYGYAAQQSELSEARSEGNTEFLRSGASMARLATSDIASIKAAMEEAGLECRPVVEEVAL